MRVIYLTEWSPYQESGVLKKLVAQVATWRQQGVTAQLISICPLADHEPACAYDELGVVVGKFSEQQLRRYPYLRLGYFNKVLSVREAEAKLKSFAPDIIYYRQHGPWYPGLGRLLSAAPTVIEINTREEMDSKLWGVWVDLMETRTRELVHCNASGFVCMTEEISRPFLKRNLPVSVIPNSLNIYPIERLPPTGNIRPAFVMVATPLATTQCWHGVDKLFGLARALPGFDFNVVGYSSKDYPSEKPAPNLKFHGYLTSEALKKVYSMSDIGLGSLATHRKSLTQACPLKTREYLSYGLPVILGYHEAEESLRTKPYVLEIGNHEGNVIESLDRIVSFAEKWRNRRVTDDLGFMSRQQKERQRLAFFRDILASSTAAHA